MTREARGPMIPVYTIAVEVDQIETTSDLPTIDTEWKHVDKAGHGHFWQDGYPTLTWVEDEPAGVDADGEEHNAEGHMECALCGEHITPAMKPPSGFRTYIPGRKTITMTCLVDDMKVTWQPTEADVQSVQHAANCEAQRLAREAVDAGNAHRIESIP